MNTKKKSKKKKIMIGLFIFVVILCVIEYYFGSYLNLTAQGEYRRYIWKYRECYWENWRDMSVSIPQRFKKDDVIKFWFETKKEKWDAEEISNICRTLEPAVREYWGPAFDSYPIRFRFEGYAGVSFSVEYRDGSQTLAINACSIDTVMNMHDIIKAFPDVTVLEAVKRKGWDSVEQITEGINDLEYLDLNCTLTEEEKEYIWSHFPGCMIKSGENFELQFKTEKEMWEMEDILKICSTRVPDIRAYWGPAYDTRPIVLHFKGCNGSLFCVTYGENNTIAIKVSSMGHNDIGLQDIAAAFPDVSVLETDGSVRWDSIDELMGIRKLEYLDLNCTFTEEEKEFITSHYPQCEMKEKN